jgi:AcrR family transcriptional regulator
VKAKASTNQSKYHHGDLRRAILESALELIDKSGVENLSLRELARVLGVTTAAPYHHFKDREALLVQIAIQGYEQLLRCLEEARSLRKASQTQLEAESRAYLSFAHEHTALYSVMFSREVAGKDEYPALRQTADLCFHLVCATIAQSAEVSKGKVARAALCTWSMLHGLAMLDRSNFLEEDRAEQADIAVEGVLSLVKSFR